MTAHGALEADFPPGALVEYCPPQRAVRERMNERGLVVRANDSYVFVRFEAGPSKAVSPLLLVLIAHPIPDPRIQMLDDLIAEYRQGGGEGVPISALTDVLVGAVDSSSEVEA